MNFYSRGETPRCKRSLPTPILRVMKLTILLITLACLQVSAATFAQNITLHEKNASLRSVLADIQQQTGFDLFYQDQFLKDTPVTIDVKNQPLATVLSKLLDPQQLGFTIQDRTITIQRKENSLLDKLKEKVKALIANIDIRGRVVEESGQPLPGATVTVKSTSNITATDVNGYFTLRNVDPGAIIVLTSIGFEKQELPVKAEMGTIKMTQAQSKLDEVQVIAYGQITERLNIGNSATIKGEEIAKQPVSNVLDALEGKVAGLLITQANGLPGGGVQVRVQGQNSIGNGNDPFYVIDGVPYASQTIATVGSILSPLGSSAGPVGSGKGNPLDYINPNDIESVTVLKDADATSIYGSRAANGAIIITTKKGKAGDTKVSLNLQNGWGKVTRMLDLMNTQQYIQMRQQALRNDGINSPSSTDYDINGLWNQSSYTNWQKQLIGNTAAYQDLNGSISGGTENIQYLVSGTFHRETSVFDGAFSDKKGGLHFSLNSSSKNHRFHFLISGSYLTDDNFLPSADPTPIAITLAPDAPSLYNGDGTLNWAPNSVGASSWTNPLASLLKTFQSLSNNLVSSAVMGYTILPGLDIKSNFGYNNLQINETVLSPLTAQKPENRPLLGATGRVGDFTNNNTHSWTVEPQIEYKKAISKGKLDVLMGGTIDQRTGAGTAYYGNGYNSDAVLGDIHSAATVVVTSTADFTYKYAAVFGRVNYNWQDKYIIDLTARRDGSSRFGANNQFHDFGSVGAAWIFTEEPALKKISWLSFGKLHSSFGTTGNDQIGDYKFLDLYNASNPGVPYQGITSISTSGLPNPYLQWELTKKFQSGLEIGLFNNRVLINADYAYNRSSNELLSLPLPSVAGFQSVISNIPATIQNTSFELSLNTTTVKSKEFTWTQAFTLTLPKNKLISESYLLPSASWKVGQPLGTIAAYHFIGVDPAAGLYEFTDARGNPTSSPSSATDLTSYVNTVFPKAYGSFQNSFQYHRIRLDFTFNFSKQKGPGYLFGNAPGTVGVNQPKSVLDAWSQPGQITSIQRYNSNGAQIIGYLDATQSDAYYGDASYIRLKNLSLSYQLAEHWLRRLGMRACNLFLTGQNLITITNYRGLDPETQSVSYLPPLKVISLGLHADF